MFSFIVCWSCTENEYEKAYTKKQHFCCLYSCKRNNCWTFETILYRGRARLTVVCDYQFVLIDRLLKRLLWAWESMFPPVPAFCLQLHNWQPTANNLSCRFQSHKGKDLKAIETALSLPAAVRPITSPFPCDTGESNTESTSEEWFERAGTGCACSKLWQKTLLQSRDRFKRVDWFVMPDIIADLGLVKIKTCPFDCAWHPPQLTVYQI